MVVDVFTLNDEADLFDFHYNILEPYVDEFRVITFDKTFSGKMKEKIFPDIEFEKYPKAKWYLNTESTYGKYRELAESSPNTQGAEHWKLEFMQKESIKDCLTDLKDNDIVFISDCDEVWSSHLAKTKWLTKPMKLKLKVYTYYLNNTSSEQFWGTVMLEYRHIKDGCLNHIRTDAQKTETEWGWHFTSMAFSLRKKLIDSYTHESYATPIVLSNLEYNISHGKDFLGRNFTYKLDESAWPQYLKDNREKYAHLCK